MTRLLKVAQYLEQKHLNGHDLNNQLDLILNAIDSRLSELDESSDANDLGVLIDERKQLNWLKNTILGNGSRNLYDKGPDFLTPRELDIIVKMSKIGETDQIRTIAKNILRLISYHNLSQEEDEQVA